MSVGTAGAELQTMKMFQIVVDGAAAASASDDNGNKVLKRTRRHFPKTIDANVSDDGRTVTPSNGNNVRATKELIAGAAFIHTISLCLRFLSFLASIFYYRFGPIEKVKVEHDGDKSA